jgi:hypothetical protein
MYQEEKEQENRIQFKTQMKRTVTNPTLSWKSMR